MIGLLVYGGVLIVTSVLTVKRPHIALVGVFSMFALDQIGVVYHSFFRTHGAFTNIYILSLVAIAVALKVRNSRFSLAAFGRYKVRLLATFLFLYALLSLSWAPESGWIYWSSAWPYLVTSILLAPLLIKRTKDLDDVQSAFMLLGGLLVLFLATVPEWDTRSLVIVDTGEPLGVPLSLAQMSGYLLIIAVLKLEKSYIRLAWLMAAVAVSLVVTMKTGARGQFVFSILSIILVTPFVWKRFTFRTVMQLVTIIMSISLASFYIFTETNAVPGRWEADKIESDIFGRLDMAAVVLKEWMNSPAAIIFGLGNSYSRSPDVLGIYPHIVVLEVLGEEGFIGLFIFLFIIYFSLRQSRVFKRLSHLPMTTKRTYAANFACFLFTLLLSFKQGALITSSAMFLFAVLSEKYFYLMGRDVSSNPLPAHHITPGQLEQFADARLRAASNETNEARSRNELPQELI